MLEELLAAGVSEAEYDAWLINIGEGDQFSSGFVDVNPNSKIPAMVDTTTTPETKLFESGSILVYLAEKFGKFIPQEAHAKAECFNWLFWQVGSAPYLGGGFGHFYSYAPYPMEYPINRFTMETKRQLDVLDKHLADNEFMAGSEYSIADMAIWPWYGNLVLGNLYDAATFLQVHEYTNLVRWAKQLEQREGVKRGRIVNRTWGDDGQLENRHSAKDIDDALAKA
jgi:GST-like protein